ncbi:MAG TPA: hypothetical protein VJZ27_02815 [Aggregatilineales bacterium]|nr:hypothetical protein [Aggregatilineales bacterium]
MNNILKQITSLSLIAMLLFGVNFAAAQDEINTDDWIIQQGAKSYVRVPDAWLNVTDPESMGEIIDQITATNPQFATVFATIQPQIEAGLIDIYLIEPITTATMAILISDPGMSITLDDLEGVLAVQYETVGGVILDTQTVELPAGQALRVHLTLPMQTATGETLTSEQYQYFMIDDTDLVVLNFGGAQENFEELAPLFDAVASTFGLGEAPAETATDSKDDKPTQPIGERDDIVRVEGEGFTMVVPSDWLDASNPDALPDYIAAGNPVDPMTESFFESMAGQITGNTYSVVYIQPGDLAYMIHYFVEFPAEISIATLEDSVLQPIKDDPEIELVDNQIVQTTAGEALRVDVRRPIRGDIIHYEIRYIILGAGQMNFFFFAVPDERYENYAQTFQDMMNTMNFTR